MITDEHKCILNQKNKPCTMPNQKFTTIFERSFLPIIIYIKNLFFFSVKLKHFQKFEDTTEALASAASLIEGKLCKSLKKVFNFEYVNKL